ncbi:Ku protein [Streptomyces rubradiris]|uniref:Ku protein n=1 Tax=Streptomyces rubradiris TaxID=285531 RepID=UPI0033FCB397
MRTASGPTAGSGQRLCRPSPAVRLPDCPPSPGAGLGRPLLPRESVDPVRIAGGYYLQPAGQVAAKPYKLLVKALSRSAKVAVAKYAWSGRERLGLLRVGDDVLVLHATRRPDEIRDPTQLLPPPTEVSHKEIASALALMDTMTVDRLEGPEFTDRYSGAIARIIEAKREEKPRCCSPRRRRHRPGAAYGSTPAAERHSW